MEVTCTQCGRSNAAGRKFCGDCGAALGLTCHECGARNDPGDRFCGECGTSLLQEPTTAPTEAAPEPRTERRLVSVLFADLVGFTPFSEDRDPEEVRAFLTSYFDTSREVIERFGGEVDKFIGDAVMAVWGASVAMEDDAERAVRAALELVDSVEKQGAELGTPEITVRVGILTGEAAVGPGGNERGLVVGDLVNTASRLQSIAPVGSVVVGESTVRATETAIEYQPLGDQELKGKSLPTPAWRAIRLTAMRRGERRSSSIEPPFVGRANELRLMKDLLHSVGTERRPRVLSIVGLAGIGKTRLTWELAKYVDGLVEVVYWHEGRSPAFGDGITFWALSEMVRRRAKIHESDPPDVMNEKLGAMLEAFIDDEAERRRLHPRLAGLLGLEGVPEGDRAELFSAFRSLFERIAAKGTTVLVFEDLQWADDGLLDFIDELVDWSRSSPIFVVALARPELLERRPGWGSARRDWVSVHLGPLNPDDMRSLIEGMAPGIPSTVTTEVLERAAGVPLYAVELVRMLIDHGDLVRDDSGFRFVGSEGTSTVPESLHALIGARLDRLSPAQRDLLQKAAVLGQSFHVAALSVLEGEPSAALADDLSDLVRREILELDLDERSPERGQYRFLQALIRDVAYSRLSRNERRKLHLAAAAHYEDLDDLELAPVVAYHYLDAYRAVPEEGGELAERAQRALLEAADRAAGLGSHQQALSLARQALTIADDSELTGMVLARAAESALDLLETDEADRFAREEIAWYTKRGDRLGRLTAITRRARMLSNTGDPAEAGEILAGAVAEIGEPVRQPEVAAFAELARALMRLGRGQEALSIIERAIGPAEHGDMLPEIAEMLNTRGTVLGTMGRLREGLALLEGSRRLAAAHELLLPELRALANIGYIAGYDDYFTQAEEATQIGLDRALKLGLSSWAVFFAGNLVGPFLSSGRFIELAEMIDMLEAIHPGESELPRWRAVKARAAAIRGDEVEQAVLDAILEEASSHPDPQHRTAHQNTVALIELLTGKVEAGLDRVLASFYSHPSHEAYFLMDAYSAAVLARDEERIRAFIEAFELAGRHGRFVRAAHDCLIAAQTAEEDPDRAFELFERSRRALESRPSTDLALCRISFAVSMPEHPGAAEALEEGRQMLTDLGAFGFLRMVDGLVETVPRALPG